MDLKFPHHEMRRLPRPLQLPGKIRSIIGFISNMPTRQWTKMSKSLGNSFLPSELFAATTPLLTRGLWSHDGCAFSCCNPLFQYAGFFQTRPLSAAAKGIQKRLGNALVTVKKLDIPRRSAASELTAELQGLSGMLHSKEPMISYRQDTGCVVRNVLTDQTT